MKRFLTAIIFFVSYSAGGFQVEDVGSGYWIGGEVILTCFAKVRHADWAWEMTSPGRTQNLEDVQQNLDCIGKSSECEPTEDSIGSSWSKNYEVFLSGPYNVSIHEEKYQFFIPKYEPFQNDKGIGVLQLKQAGSTPIMGHGREDHFVLTAEYIFNEPEKHSVLVLEKDTDEIELIEFLDRDGLRFFRIRDHNFLRIDTQGGGGVSIDHGYCEWKKGR